MTLIQTRKVHTTGGEGHTMISFMNRKRATNYSKARLKRAWSLRMGHLLAESFFGSLGLLYIFFDIRSSSKSGS